MLPSPDVAPARPPAHDLLATDRLHASEAWLAYFRDNERNQPTLPWADGATLSPPQRRVIGPSIRQFQLGESSEGHHLQRLAARYAARTGDAAYAEAMMLFIREEQRHGRDLGRYMDLAGIPRATTHWSDTVFRSIRKMSNLEMMLSVLLMAEMIANVYYAALHDATPCPLLRKLCRQILQDEAAHIRFHVERLSRLRVRRRHSLPATRALYRQFFRITTAVVWHTNAPVFRLAGRSFQDYWHACTAEIEGAERWDVETSPFSKAVSTDKRSTI